MQYEEVLPVGDAVQSCLEKYPQDRTGTHNYKEYLTCFYITLNILDEDNNLDKTKLKAYIFQQRGYDVDKSALVDECAVKKESPKETAFHLQRCIYKDLMNY